jgi:hypothetical protein
VVILIILGNDESVVYKNDVKCDGTLGTIILTNKRLLFDFKKGLFSKRTYFSNDIVLKDIRAVTIEGFIKKKLYIITNNRAGRMEIEVDDPEYLQYKIGELLV